MIARIFQLFSVPCISESEHLYHLVPLMVDDLDRDPTRPGTGERTRDVAVERRPCLGVDLGLERRLEGLLRVAGADEVVVPDEEALFVVVGVDEPARDPVCAVASDFAGVRGELRIGCSKNAFIMASAPCQLALCPSRGGRRSV